MSVVVWAVLVAALAVVFRIGGALGLTSLWNALPLVAAAGLWRRAWRAGAPRSRTPGAPRRSRPVPWPAAAGVLATAAVTVLVHLAWWFDWGGTATAPSTSGLVLVIAPVLASLAGLGAFALVRLAASDGDGERS